MTPQTVLSVLILLILAIIGLLMYQSFYHPMKEGFDTSTNQQQQQQQQQLTFCPHKTQSYYNNNDLACCDGPVIGNTCESGPICSRAPQSVAGLVSCRQYLLDYYTLKSREVCPSSMKNYYEDEKGVVKGCTAAALTSDLTKPWDPNNEGPSCKIYPTDQENLTHVDSCLNARELELAACEGKDCVKQITVPPNSKVPLIEIQYNDADNVRRSCYTNISYNGYRQSMNITSTPKNPPELCDESFKKYLQRDESR